MHRTAQTCIKYFIDDDDERWESEKERRNVFYLILLLKMCWRRESIIRYFHSFRSFNYQINYNQCSQMAEQCWLHISSQSLRATTCVYAHASKTIFSGFFISCCVCVGFCDERGTFSIIDSLCTDSLVK